MSSRKGRPAGRKSGRITTGIPAGGNVRPSSSVKVRGDRAGRSTAVVAWRSLEGWAVLRRHRGGWHLFRHARTACGAWRWLPSWGAPQLVDKPNDARTVCKRCLARSSSSSRRLSRDQVAA